MTIARRARRTVAGVVALTGLLVLSATSATAATTSGTSAANSGNSASLGTALDTNRATSADTMPVVSSPADAAALASLVTHPVGNPAPGISTLSSTPASAPAPETLTANPTKAGAVQPADLQAAYQIPDTATTEQVGVVVVGNYPQLEVDLAQYRATFGLPACTVASGCLRILNSAGATAPLPAQDAGWDAETALDVDMVSAACPTCSITVVESDPSATGDGWYVPTAGTLAMHLEYGEAVKTAVRLGAKIINMSGGWTSDMLGLTGYPANVVQQALTVMQNTYFAAPGVAYVASAGDDGSEAEYPASFPTVLSVGGTTLTQNATDPVSWSSAVWNDGYTPLGFAGSGGACSDLARPAWQNLVAGPSGICTGGKAGVDISAVADPAPPTGGVWYIFGGELDSVGGTSAASPITAALYAVANPNGWANTTSPASWPYLNYAANPALITDVTSGNNDNGSPLCASSPLVCYAGAGWDGPTGLGVPNGVGAFAAVAGTVSIANPGAKQLWYYDASTVSVTAHSAAPGAITYTASGLPASSGLSVTPAGVLTGTLRAKWSGTVNLTVTATDAYGASASTSFPLRMAVHRVTTAAKAGLKLTGKVKAKRTIGYTPGARWCADTTGCAASGKAAVSVKHVWYVGGHKVSTSTKLKLKAAWRGKKVKLVLTAKHANWLSYSKTLIHKIA